MRCDKLDSCRKLKVALIHNIISPYRIPLFEELSKNPNIDLTVFFTAESEKNREWIIKHNFLFDYKILPKITLNLGKEIFYHINPTIFRELFNGNFDIIVSAGYSSFTNQTAFFVAKFLRIPFILWSGSTENEPNLLRKLSLPLIKCIVKNSDAFIAYGTRAKEYLVKLGAPQNKVFISFNTVDTKFFKETCLALKDTKYDLKNKLGFNHEYIVLYVGQLIERKGLKYLLYAHKKLSKRYNVGLVLVGNGKQKSELINLCKIDTINNVYFVDFVQKKDLPIYYSIADIFVLPSIEEVWGLVVNEAMACGLPIITTKYVGASEDLVVNGKNGYVVAPKDSLELYNSMLSLLDNDLVNSMGKQSSILIDLFSIGNASKSFINAIYSLVEDDKSSAQILFKSHDKGSI